MFRSLGRCRTGLLILAGALVATGLSAREVHGLRASDDATARGVITPSLPISVEHVEAPSLDLQLDILHGRLKNVSDVRSELNEPFAVFAEALRSGSIDDAAIWACVSTIADVQIQDKYDGLMRDFAQRILADQPGFPVQEFDMHDRPLAWRVGIPDVNPVSPKALCNTCTTPSAIPNPTLACQYVSGNTTSACPSDFYSTTLTAGTTYEFTFCTAVCAGASATWDTRIRIRQSGSCTVLVDNDDSCGLQSRATYTPSTTGTYVIEVTGYTTSNFGSYTLGWKQAPPSTCGTCAAPLFTITPTSTCQFVSNSNATCPNSSTATTTSGGVWYNVNLTGGRQYTFSTCPNNAAGGACFGTATFDTRLDLWNSACTTRLAGNDDITCSLIFRSAFIYTAPSTGLYKLQVRGFTTDTGNYTLAYQELTGCQAASITSNTPTLGTITSTAGCTLTQTFSVGLNSVATAPFSGTWNIVAPPGSSASPSAGAMTFSGTTGSFSSTLTKTACGTAPFTVNVTVTNCSGASSSSRTWTYTLRDGRGPTLSPSCPASTQLDCAAPDPPAPTLSATDNCDPAPTVTFTETRVNGNCPGNYTTRRTWTARDCNSNTTTCTQNLTHRDTTPPTLSGADSWCMYPPNHEYYCIMTSELSPTMSDNCSLPVTLLVVGCVSNEPDEGTGDGDFPNDCVVSPDGKEICLRVERSGNLNDRIYGILGIAVDACGNRSAPQPIAVVTVPHDDSEHPECREANSGLDKHF